MNQSAESNDYIISLKQEYQEQIKNTIAFRDLLSNLYNAQRREENELVNWCVTMLTICTYLY